ncbi:MAG: response regulator transcription factor [Colwellia sp.]
MSTLNTVSSDNTLSCTSNESSLLKKSILFFGGNAQKSELHDLFYLEDYDIRCEADINSLSESIVQNAPKLVIYEIGTTSQDKLSAVREIRTFYEGALMVVATSSSEQAQVSAFNIGVDEFLVKPVSFNIILCRVKALLKRCESNYVTSPDKILIGDIALFPQSQKCEVKNTEVPLTFFEFKLLMLLAKNAGKVMSREEIYSSLLSRAYNGSERTVDVRMSQLRDKLSIRGVKNGAIETVWGRGYMFNVAA